MRKRNFAGTLNHASVIVGVAAVVMIFGFTAMPLSAAKPVITDLSISDAVGDELLMDKAVPSYRITVATVNGIVSLRGSVDNILAKERAARIAGIVKGVRGVVNKLKVDPPVLRTDLQIRDDVEDALLTDPATDSFEIDVKVSDNVVTLAGTVQSWQEHALCEKVAKGVKGVKRVNNEINVVWPKERSDYEIKTDVENALKWDAFVDHALIDVKVKDGEVILSGTVGSAAEKSQAAWAAYVNGVKSVDHDWLKVSKWARDEDLKGEKYAEKSDKEIADAVSDALLYDPRVSFFKVTPEVSEMTVTLRGTVDNLKAKRAAAEDARNTVGVRRVENRIKVRPTELRSDRKIEEKISRAFLRDPYLESYEITVDVRNGVANLYGTVDSYFEKSQADDVASRVNGVIMVDNNLVVQRKEAPYTYDPYVDNWYSYDFNSYYRSPPHPFANDWQIKKDIEDELFWSPFVDADDVNVTVEEGVATLTGSVDSWSEYHAAANNAYDGGAVYVDNELAVK
jgi:osmotically-inducible protein OsmY